MSEVVNTLATKIRLDIDDSSLYDLRQEMKYTNAEWNTSINTAKLAGNSYEAASAKVIKEKDSIELLKKQLQLEQEELSKVTGSTKEDESARKDWESQIRKTSNDLAKHTNNLEKAENYEKLYANGVLQSKKALSESNEVYSSRAEKLKAEGKQLESLNTKLEGNKVAFEKLNSIERGQISVLNENADKVKKLSLELDNARNSLNKMDSGTEVYKKQANVVNDLANKLEKATTAYNKQEIQVNKTQKQTADLKNETDDLQHELIKINGNSFDKLMEKIKGTKNEADGATHSFRDFFLANIATNVVSAGWQSIKTHIGQATEAGMEYNKEQQKMIAAWTTLTGDQDKAKGMVKTINEIAVATGQATDTVDELEQGFYHLHSNKKESDEMTRAMLNMSDAVGLTGDQIQSVTQDMVHGLSSGKANMGTLNQISQYFPMFKESLAEYETQVNHGKEVTVSDLNEMVKKGKISADDIEKVFTELGNVKYGAAADNMLSTMVGAERVIKARMPVLIGAIEKPVMEAQNPFTLAMSKWLSDNKTEQEFNEIGKSISTGLGTITKAFSDSFTTDDMTNGLDEFLESTANNITKLSRSIANHSIEIKQFFSMFKETSTLQIKITAEVMKDLSKILLPMLSFIAKHSDLFAPIIAGMIALKVTASPIIGTMKIIQALTDGIFGTAKKMNEFFSRDTNADKDQIKYKQLIDQTNNSLQKQTELQASKTNSPNVTDEEAVSLEKTEVSNNGNNKRGIKLNKAGIGLSVAGAGMNLMGMNKENQGEKLGGSIGMIAGGTIGSALGPVGSIIGSAIGDQIGSSVGPSIAKSLSKNKSADALVNWGKQTTKKIVDSQNAAMKSYKLDISKMSNKQAYSVLEKEAQTYTKKIQDTHIKNLNALKKNGVLTQQEYDKRVNDIKNSSKKEQAFLKSNNDGKTQISEYYNKKRAELEKNWNNKIYNDRIKFGDHSKKVKQDEVNKSKALDKQLLHFATDVTNKEAENYNSRNKILRSSSDKEVKIVSDLNRKKGKLSQDELNDAIIKSGKIRDSVINNARKAYDSSISIAKKKRDDIVKAANEEFKGHDKASEEQRKSVINKADDQYKQSVSKAKSQREKTTDHANKQHDDVVNAAHSQNKKVTQDSADQAKLAKKDAKDQKDKVTKYMDKQTGDVINAAQREKDGKGNWQDQTKKHTGQYLNDTDSWETNAYNDIAWIVGKFGIDMKPRTVKKVAFANGTGRNPITENVHAMLNDGNDSPETDNKELAILPNGKSFIPQERNWTGYLPAGTEILNATETKNFMNLQGIHKFAKGTGFLSGISDSISNVLDKSISSVEDLASNLIDDSDKIFKNIFPNKPKKKFNPNNKVLENISDNGIWKTTKDSGKKYWDKIIKKITDEYASSYGDPNSTSPAATGNHKHWLKQAGIPDSQFDMYNYIVSHESSWNPHAKNPGSDAYGIPQSLPGSKMASSGKDWHDNPITQLKWMKGYVNERYGGIKNAYDFWHSHHWYSNGGLVKNNQLAEIAENNMPEMIIPMSPEKRPRAMQLANEVVTQFAKDDPNLLDKKPQTNNIDLSKLENKFDKVINLLCTIAGLSKEQINAILNTAQTPLQRQKADASDQSIKDFQRLGGFS